MKIIIPRTIISKLIEHALLEDPNECCGLLLGKENTVLNIENCNNVHSSPKTRYTIDPKDLLIAEKFSDDHKMNILAIYHSHTHSQAYPSKTDIENAVESMWTNPYYVLISLVEKTRPIIRAFKISDNKNVEETIIEHDGDAYISPTENA
jgi:proteasome lid subunit RPN8/RPN11